MLAIGAVATVVVGWGVAQWPYMLPESLEGLRRPPRHRRRSKRCSIVFGLAAVIILPSLALLYSLDQKSLLAEEGTDQLSSAS